MLANQTYNWDDLQVGEFEFNHSQNFFSHKHSKHEKFSEEFGSLGSKMAAMQMKDLKNESMENKENNGPIVQNKKTKNDNLLSPPPSNNQTTCQTAKISTKTNIKEEKTTKHQDQKIKSPTSPSTSNIKRRPPNLLTKFKTPPPPPVDAKINAKGAAKVIEPPHAYDFKDIYKRKKEEMIKKVLEEEKKNRIFHSRPVPKSVIMPPMSKTKPVSHRITCPTTPNVLKNSRKDEEKRRLRSKIGEETGKSTNPVKLSLRNQLLNEELKKSQKNRVTVEEKKKQEEEERKKHEEEKVKEIRKVASFKARPNPFSNK